VKMIEEYIVERRSIDQSDDAASRKLQFYQKIRDTVQKFGYWHYWDPVPSFVMTMHGLPDRFDQERNYHNHLFFEMVYVYHGSFVNTTPTHDFVLEQGDLMLINPKALHCPYTRREDDYIFNFLLPIEEMLQHLSFFQSSCPLLYSFLLDYFYNIDYYPDSLIFHTQDDLIIRRLMEALILEIINSDPPYRFPAAYLALLFTSLSRFYQKSPEQDTLESFPTDIMKILSYLNQNFRSTSLKDVAQHFGYTPNYLSRYIKKKTGKNFSMLLIHSKLRSACSYLENSQMTLQEICEASGFYDVSSFCKIFKKQFGVTPSDYRKNVTIKLWDKKFG
jgi:AraC-like DNA-binding protein